MKSTGPLICLNEIFYRGSGYQIINLFSATLISGEQVENFKHWVVYNCYLEPTQNSEHKLSQVNRTLRPKNLRVIQPDRIYCVLWKGILHKLPFMKYS